MPANVFLEDIPYQRPAYPAPHGYLASPPQSPDSGRALARRSPLPSALSKKRSRNRNKKVHWASPVLTETHIRPRSPESQEGTGQATKPSRAPPSSSMIPAAAVSTTVSSPNSRPAVSGVSQYHAANSAVKRCAAHSTKIPLKVPAIALQSPGKHPRDSRGRPIDVRADTNPGGPKKMVKRVASSTRTIVPTATQMPPALGTATSVPALNRTVAPKSGRVPSSTRTAVPPHVPDAPRRRQPPPAPRPARLLTPDLAEISNQRFCSCDTKYCREHGVHGKPVQIKMDAQLQAALAHMERMKK